MQFDEIKVNLLTMKMQFPASNGVKQVEIPVPNAEQKKKQEREFQ